MNPRRSRPNSSKYWSSTTIKRPKPHVSQSVGTVQNELKYDSKKRLQSSKSAHSKVTEQSTTTVGLSLAQFRLLHRQSQASSRLWPRYMDGRSDSTEKKYLVKGSALLKSQDLVTCGAQEPKSASQVNLVELEQDDNTDSKMELRLENKRQNSKVQNFTCSDLNPNYLIDQYYYTRQALNKVHTYPGCLRNKKDTEDRLKLKLANHVIKEMKKISDASLSNKTKLRGKTQPSHPQLFFKDYYTDTANMGSQFTRERKVKIWLKNCSFQNRASKVDIPNAWTNRI